MADYGEKKLISSVTTRNKANKNKIYALMNVPLTNSWGASSDKPMKAEKCFCEKCQKTIDLSMTITDAENRRINYNFRDFMCELDNNFNSSKTSIELSNGQAFDSKELKRTKIKCPDCGSESEIKLLPYHENPNANNASLPTNFKNQKNSWIIPKAMTGIYLFEYSKNGKTTRLDKNTMFKDTVVFPSYKTYSCQAEICESMDFVNHSANCTFTRIQGDTRKLVTKKDMHDFFQYENRPDVTGDIFINTARAHATSVNYLHACFPCQSFWMERDAEEKAIKNTIAENTDGSITDTENKIKELMLDRMFKSIPDEHNVFNDRAKNGLLNDEHHVGQDNLTEHVSGSLINRYALMITKYPVAVLYAKERAEIRITNAEYDEKRRKDADPDYEIKEIPDSARGRMFREEMNYVSEQLAACDDTILKEIYKSRTLDEMKAKLKFIAFGPNAQDAEMPSYLSIKDASDIKTDPIAAAKTLKKEFQKDPIAVANNMRTLQKLGITEPTAVFEAMELAKTAPDVNEKPKRGMIRTNIQIDTSKNANLLVPIHSKPMMRFMKQFANSHSNKQVLDLFNNNNMRTVAECINLYEPLAASKNVNITTGTEELNKTDEDIEKERTERIKDYLRFHPIKEAYRDFVEIYDKNTVEKVNEAARELKNDMELDKAKEHYEKTGEILPEIAHKYSNAKDIIEAWTPTKDRPVTLTTRNNKPLFKNRTIEEIHDELAVNLSKKNNKPNQKIEYTDKERELEAEYPVPEDQRTPDMPKNATWGFKLMDDTFMILRTASELHNCMGGGSYADRALRKSALYLRMNDHTGHAIAAIEMVKTGNTGVDEQKYKILQFQEDHDMSVAKEHMDIAKQWISDNNINANCRDVEMFGSGKAIYGGGTTDFHHEEIDDVYGRAVSTDKFKQLQQSRLEKATALYGKTQDGKLNLPEIPEDLAEFN